MSRNHFLAKQILLELSGASLKYFVSIHSFNMQGTSLLCNPKSVPMSNSPVHYGPFVRDINRVHMIPKPVKKSDLTQPRDLPHRGQLLWLIEMFAK